MEDERSSEAVLGVGDIRDQKNTKSTLAEGVSQVETSLNLRSIF